jgi:hypothetical protein
VIGPIPNKPAAKLAVDPFVCRTAGGFVEGTNGGVWVFAFNKSMIKSNSAIILHGL